MKGQLSSLLCACGGGASSEPAAPAATAPPPAPPQHPQLADTPQQHSQPQPVSRINSHCHCLCI